MKSKQQIAQTMRASKQPRDELGRFAEYTRRSLNKAANPSFVDSAVVEYKTRAVIVDGRKYQIPIDSNGKVPKEEIAARYLNMSEGARKGRQYRSPVSDSGITAHIVLPADITPEGIKKWWAHPNTCDVQGIDTADSPLYDVKTLKKQGSKEYQKKIAVDGTEREQKIVRKTIENSYTVAEQKNMVKKGGLVISVCDLDSERTGKAGGYEGMRNGMSYRIRVDKNHVGDGDTLLHETVHHSRMVDDSRDSPILKSRSKSDKLVSVYPVDVALEEAATVAEALTRQSDYRPPDDSGYYGLVSRSTGKNAKKLIEEDRRMFVGSSAPGSKGLKGQRAKKSVERGFSSSNIKDLNLNRYDRRFPNISAEERLRAISESKTND